MKAMAGIVILVLAWGSNAPGAPSQLRGYTEINRVVRQRLFVPDSKFQLGQYLEESYSEIRPNLLDLLGTYKGGDLTSQFRGGSPNAASMLLWYFVMASLARDVSAQCGRGSTLDLREDFKAAVATACRWPAPRARSPEALERFWMLVMAFDAPRSEFLTWKAFIEGATFASSEEAVFSMMLTITCNPRFLLRS